MLDKQVLALLTFCTWSSLGGIIHLDGLADDYNPIASVVFTEFIKDAPNIRITNRIPVEVPVPHLFPVDRVQTVEIPQPRPYAVDSPYPVPVNQPVAYPVPQDVPVPVSQPVPYPVPQEVPFPVSKPFPWPVPQPFPFPVSGGESSGTNLQYSSQELEVALRHSLGEATATLTTGPSEGTSDIAGLYVPQYQTPTEPRPSESPQQSDGTSTTLPSSQGEIDSGNLSSGAPYSASAVADTGYASELLPLLKSYLEILQQQHPQQPTAPQTGEPPQSNTTLENVSGAQLQSGILTFPTIGNYLGYGLQDHAGLSLQSPGVPQSVAFSSHVTPQVSESSVNATAQQQQDVQEGGSSSGHLTATQDQNRPPAFSLFAGNPQPLLQIGASTLPTSDNYLYNSEFIYPYFPYSGTNNILSNTQPYPYLQSQTQSQSTVNEIPGIQSAPLGAGSSSDNVQQAASGTSTAFQNYQNYDSFENQQNYISEEKVNAQLRLITLQNLLSLQTALSTPAPTSVNESPKQVPVNLGPPPVGEVVVQPETTESPQMIEITTVSSVSSPAPLNISTSAPPESNQIVNPPPVKDQERLEARSPSDNTRKDPEPLSEPPTTTTTTTSTVTQLDEKLTTVTTTAEPETTSIVMKPSPTPVVTAAEPQNVQTSTQLLAKPENPPDPQYRILSLPFVQPQLLTLPQQQRQQLQVVVTQI